MQEAFLITVIIKRYLNKELFSTTSVVMMFLIMMIMGSWLIRYFGMAAQGKLDFSVVFELLFYQIPSLLEFIFPLSFFVGLMLTLGRLYVDHEMTIFRNAGISPMQIASMLSPFLLLAFFFQSFISFYAKPAGFFAAEKLQAEQAVKSAFDLVKPKTFVSFNQFNLYVGGYSADKRDIEDIILIEKSKQANKPDSIIIAKSARQLLPDDLLNTSNLDTNLKASNSETTSSDTAKKAEHTTQLDLYHGRRYELGADNLAYNLVSFERYRLSINIPKKNDDKTTKLEAQSTRHLLSRIQDDDAKAELGFRASLPLVILLALILALPLSEVRPRQGRWIRLIPAIILFVTSVLILMSLKGSIAKGKSSVWLYLLVISLYTLFGFYLYHKNGLHKTIKRKLGKAPDQGGA